MEYTLENEYLKLTVSSKGAEVISLVRKCDGVEHMWQADPEVWGFHAPVLFPYCGRVVGDTIHAKGADYPAKQHGFARNLEHTLVWSDPGYLELALESDDETRKQFPYDFRLLSTFTLEGDKVHHTLTVENLDEEALPFGIGYHPGFQVPFDDKHTAADYELRFSDMESPLCVNNLPKGLVHGNLYYLGTNIDALPVCPELFANDSHCMTNLVSDTLGLYEKGTGRAVICHIADFPYTLIWSKPGDVKFVCIEPWHSLPSPENGTTDYLQKPAAAILAPGESWSTTLTTEFKR